MDTIQQETHTFLADKNIYPPKEVKLFYYKIGFYNNSKVCKEVNP